MNAVTVKPQSKSAVNGFLPIVDVSLMLESQFLGEFGHIDDFEPNSGDARGDGDWLVSLISDLLADSNQIERLPKIKEELRQRGYLGCDLQRYSRIGSPFSQFYTEIDEIGSGSYGKVEKVINLIDKQTYALKIVEIEREYAKTAVREIQCLAHLNSPRIVRYFSAWFEENESDLSMLNLYIQMELIQGQSLQDYIKTRKQIDYEYNLYLIYEVAVGLSEIHSKGIVHRDIAPSNILIRAEGGIAIIDFGISSIRKSNIPEIPDHEKTWNSFSNSPINDFTIEAADPHFKTVEEMGTPLYISQRQASGQPSKSKDDIYSLGIVAYELFSSFVTTMEATRSILALKNNRSMSQSLKQSYPEMAKLIMKMTDNDPHHRPSAKELVSLPIFDDVKNKL